MLANQDERRSGKLLALVLELHFHYSTAWPAANGDAFEVKMPLTPLQ